MKPLWTILILLGSAGSPASSGQTSANKPIAQMPASARNLIAITATGSKRFSQDAIAAATSLQLGAPVDEEDFKKAARRLGDTGAFTDIAYSFNYSPTGTKLEFHVTDAEKFVPARFEDFVWFPETELRKHIQEHVPLFNGELPLSGRMPDEVSDVLQAMLVEKGIPGHVDYVRAGKQDGPVESIDYKVSEVLIRIRKVEFTGAGQAELPVLESAARNLTERGYSATRLQLLVDRDLLPVYYSRGYLKASFGPPQPKPVNEPSPDAIEEGGHSQSLVDVTFAVTPGQQYKLKSLSWSGNHEFPGERLEKMIHVQPGQPANTVRLGEDLKEIQKLYGSHGFVTAKLKTGAQFDDAAATVAVAIDVTEGPAFHMGELEFRGLDNTLTAKLRDTWKLRAGDVYNANYLEEYLPAAQKLLPASLDWNVEPHVTANVRDKTVDVDLVYTVKAPN